MNIVDKIIAKEKQNKLLRSKGIIVLDDFKFDKTKKERQETLNKFYKGEEWETLQFPGGVVSFAMSISIDFKFSKT